MGYLALLHVNVAIDFSTEKIELVLDFRNVELLINEALRFMGLGTDRVIAMQCSDLQCLALYSCKLAL